MGSRFHLLYTITFQLMKILTKGNINHLPHEDSQLLLFDFFTRLLTTDCTKANPENLKYLNTIGLYDEDVMNIASTGADVQCHLFEHSIQLYQDTSERSAYPPLQCVFALKENNAGKLDSHLCFFCAFAEQIQPEYTMLLDVGIQPTKSSFYKLLIAMETNAHIGGVCGEIAGTFNIVSGEWRRTDL